MTSARAITAISQMSSLISEVSQPPPQMQIPVELPQASDAALSFLKDLTEEEFKYLVFDDDLVTYSDNGKEVGTYKMSVTHSRRGGQDCLLVEGSSHGAVDGVPCGTSISAYITHNLDTIEQHHHEYVKLENHPLDRKTAIVREDLGYLVTKEVVQGQTHDTLSKIFEYNTMEGFISEGANLLLQRLLANKTTPAYFEVVSFDSDTNLCLSTYNDLGERSQPVQNENVKVVGIERTIHSFTNLPTTWQTFFMTDGHLITRTQVGSPVTMKVKTKPAFIEADEFLPKPVFGIAPLHIDDDMELYSKFLDRKEELQADYMLYLRDHPEVKAMLGDFLQHLLLRKPEDIIPFAGDYFATFSCRGMPANPYFSTPESTMFPQQPDMQDSDLSKTGQH